MNNFISVILGGKFQREKDQPLKESYGDYDWNTTSSVFSRAKRLTESLYNPPEQLLRRIIYVLFDLLVWEAGWHSNENCLTIL